MSAKSTGANPVPNGANGSASQRNHHDGSASRTYTSEQKIAVIRVRKCGPTAFYDILGLESEKKTVDDSGIKKAYRKLSLLTHPDKNGYDGADEAFKMVSRAFQVLSDPAKKKQYDQFGGDPDNRFSSSSTSASPFSGFGRSAGARGGGMWEGEISPEDLFRQFFGGGMGGGGFGSPFGGGLFDQGPGFVFNMNGGPGFRVHQFGGNRPRRRPQQPADPNAPPPSFLSAFQNLLPLLILFVLPLLSSIFSSLPSATHPRVPAFHLDTPLPPLTRHRVSARLKIDYYVNPVDVQDWNHVAGTWAGGGDRRWVNLDYAAENQLVAQLNAECDRELQQREGLLREAQGWFSVDQRKLDEARQLEMRSCRRLNQLGVPR